MVFFIGVDDDDVNFAPQTLHRIALGGFSFPQTGQTLLIILQVHAQFSLIPLKKERYVPFYLTVV